MGCLFTAPGSNTKLTEAPSDVGEYEVYVKYTPTDAVNHLTMYRKEAFEIKPCKLTAKVDLTTSKTYDSWPNAQVSCTPTNVVEGDSILLTAMAAYDSADVGTDKTISVTFQLSGSDKKNYTAPDNYTVTTGEIVPRTVTVSPERFTVRFWDGTNTVPLTKNGWTMTGQYTSDGLALDLSNATAKVETSDAGQNKPVIFENVVVTGNEKGNYKIEVEQRTITIQKLNLASGSVTVTFTGDTPVYTGSAVYPENAVVTVEIQNQDTITLDNSLWEFTPDTGMNNSSAGKAYAYISATGASANVIGKTYIQYTIAKATPATPAKPTMASRTDTSITLNEQSGCVYSMDKTNWQDSPTFTGLNANTAYTFYVKQTEIDNYVESAASEGAAFSTDKSYIASVSPALEQPVKNGTPDTSVEAESSGNYRVSADATWEGNPTKFLGGTVYKATFTLTPADAYKFTDDTTVIMTGAEVSKTLNIDGTMTVTATFSATATREVTSIAVKTNPSDVAYTYGDAIDPAGLVITVTYDDGTTDDVTYSESNKGDFTFGTMNAGDTTVSVTYAGKTAVISGITVAKQSVTAPQNAGSKVFNGSTQTADVDVTGKPYTVTTNDGGINVGSYDVVLTLSEPNNYKWNDSDEATKSLSFSITPADALTLTATATMVKNHASYTETIDLTTVSGYPTNPGGTPVFAIESSTTNGLDSTTISGNTLTLVADQADTDNADTVVVEVTGMGNYADTTKITVTVNYTNKTVVDITGVAAAENLTYSGAAQVGYTGTPTSAYSGEYVYSYSGTDKAGNTYGPSNTAPTNAGDYTLTISVPESSAQYSGSTTVNFSIAQKSLTITVADKSAYVGSQKPDLSTAVSGTDYTVSGLVSGDTLTVALSYVTEPEMNKAGEYEITAVASDSNYTITVVNGKLKVSYYPVYPDPTYTPTVDDTTGGDTTVSDKNPEKGDKVTITTDPDKGYEVGEITVTDSRGNEVEVIDNGDGTFTYVQPVGKVTITVTYVCNGTHNCPSLAYSDLNTSLWYHSATDYVLSNGLMNGVGNGKFDPNGTTSRAMIVTILWRLEGEPVVNYQMQFEDVLSDTWYTEAVRWAASEGIVEGYSDTAFGPDDAITREQFATILWRYAKHKGYDVIVGEDTNILSYNDAFDISEWAIPAMQWACGAGLMQGDGVNLTPKADATRTQAAALFQRFCENVAEK